MEPQFASLLGNNPQQQVIELSPIVFRSNFDSGNLHSVSQTDKNSYDISIVGDGIPWKTYGTYYFWFNFTVEGFSAGQIINFTIKNISNQGKLFATGFRPVYRVKPGDPIWKPIPGKLSYQTNPKESFYVRFEHEFTSEGVTHFALTYPFSYTDCQDLLSYYERKYVMHPLIYLKRELLGYSVERRRVDLLTISSLDNIELTKEERVPDLFPDIHNERPYKFKEKDCVFVTARVHPGEVQGSHMVNGLLAFLLKEKNPVSEAIRRKFVFKVIPMLNPDGVYRGCFRLDSLGQNLNRYYQSPSFIYQPTIYAAKQAILQQHENGTLKFYIDLHGHVNKYSTFIYGNALKGTDQLLNILFAKLLSLNSLHFDFAGCNFTESNMKVKDKIDGSSREGSSRVAIYQETKLVNCYTIEASFYGSRRMNSLSPKLVKEKNVIEQETAITNPFSKLYKGKNGAYTPEMYADIGRVYFF